MSLSEQQLIDRFMQRNSLKREWKDVPYWAPKTGSRLAGIICGLPESHGCLIVRDREQFVNKVSNYSYVLGAIKIHNAEIGDLIEITCTNFTKYEKRDVPVFNICVEHC